MKDVKLLGIDLAKDVFQLHGINEYGKKILGKKISRSELPRFIANMPACKIVLEACGSSNYWSRKFMSYGHTAELEKDFISELTKEGLRARVAKGKKLGKPIGVI